MEQSRDGQRPASVVKPVGSLYLALAQHRIVSWVSSFNPTPCFLKIRLNIIVPLHLRLPNWFPFIFPKEIFFRICDVWLAYLLSVRTCVFWYHSSGPPSRTDTKGPFSVSYFVKNEWCFVVELNLNSFRVWRPRCAFKLTRGDSDKSLARPTSRCRRTESVVSTERGVCSCAELQVFSCYRDWKEACQATRAISTT